MPLHHLLARHLLDWKQRTPYAADSDFIFPSLKARGKVPLSASIFVADHPSTGSKSSGSEN